MSRRVLLYAPLEAVKATETQTPLEALCQAVTVMAEGPELAPTADPEGSCDTLLFADIPHAVQLLAMALPDMRAPLPDAYDREEAMFRWAQHRARGATAAPPPEFGHVAAGVGISAWWDHLTLKVDRWLLLARQEAQLRDVVGEAMRQGFAEYDAARNVVGLRDAGAVGANA